MNMPAYLCGAQHDDDGKVISITATQNATSARTVQSVASNCRVPLASWEARQRKLSSLSQNLFMLTLGVTTYVQSSTVTTAEVQKHLEQNSVWFGVLLRSLISVLNCLFSANMSLFGSSHSLYSNCVWSCIRRPIWPRNTPSGCLFVVVSLIVFSCR